jgi:nicotinamidase-related amidase
MGTVRRIVREQCFGALIDVQEFFLAQVGSRPARSRIEANLASFARLLGYFRTPILATLERPIPYKGQLPKAIRSRLGDQADLIEKDCFDLTKERKIRSHLGRLNRKQAVIAGCETDVCVLQSCLGLIGLGYQVYVVEDLLFSSARNVDAAIARMKAEGAVFLTYKTLYYELVEAVEGGRHAERMVAAFGPFPDDLPDCAT